MKIINKIVEYGIYLLAFLITWQARIILRAGEVAGGFSEFKSISIYAVDVFLLILILINSIVYFKKISVKRFTIHDSRLLNVGQARFTIYLAGLELFIFISIIFSEDKTLSLYRYGLFLLGVGLFWLLQNAKYDKIKLSYSFLAGLFLQGGLAIYQFITQTTFSFKGSGMAIHKAADLGVSVIETVGVDGVAERWLRAYGGFDHPNILGAALVIGMLILFNHFLKVKEKGVVISFIVQFILLFILTAGIFFSFSRAAWLGLLVGLVTLSLGHYKKNRKEFLQIVVIIFGTFAALSLVYSNLFWTRISANGRLEEKSYVERTSSIEQGKEIIKNNWLFGGGIGNYSIKLENTEKSHPSWYYQPAHNTFILVWAEIGILGLIVFVAVLNYFFTTGIKQKDYLLAGIILSMVVMMMFDHWWWSLHFGILFFWFILGVVVQDKK